VVAAGVEAVAAAEGGAEFVVGVGASAADMAKGVKSVARSKAVIVGVFITRECWGREKINKLRVEAMAKVAGKNRIRTQ
jgi:glycerate-2-kinase